MPSGSPVAAAELVHPAYRPDIDGLRAIAVVSVVAFHAFPSMLRGGFVGVDVFFVISGFLISSIIFSNLENDRFTFSGFYARRIRRIFPALLLVLATCICVGWFLLIAEEYEGLGRHVAAGAAFLSNFALWNEAGYFDAAASQKPLLHLWSLAIEEQFYLFWPVLVWLAYRKHGSFLALTVSIALASFAANIAMVGHHPVAAFYSPFCRFWELMVGGVLAYLTLHRPRGLPEGSSAWTLVGLLIVCTSLLLIKETSEFPGWWALLPTMGSFLIIFAGPDPWVNRNVLGNRWLVRVGLISYPLYLWHWPALYFASSISTLPSRFTRFLAVAVSVALAVLTYRLVEMPLKQKQRAKAAVTYLTAGMAACGVMGVVIAFTGGVSSRLPAQFAQFGQVKMAETHSRCFLVDSVAFDPACTSAFRRPAVFIWGDSHADRLYQGFKPFQDEGRIWIMQVTGASCPPLMGYRSNGNSKCEEVNSYALEAIRQRRPELVVLNANWAADTIDLTKLESTVSELRKGGANNILLIGPAPLWNGTILRSLYRCWRPISAAEPFPDYTNCGVNRHVQVVDDELRQSAARLGIRYVSAYKILCSDAGCLTNVNDGARELTTYDYGHLSAAGARYLVTAIGESLWGWTSAGTIHSVAGQQGYSP